MGFLDDVFKRNSELDWMYDLELLGEKSDQVYLKNLAIQICINKIASTISQSKFEVTTDDEENRNGLIYLLNHRANKNMNATRFWQRFIYKLVYDNEVLVIVTDDEELLIADEFEQTEYALFEDTFKNVIAKNYEYKRTFRMSEVIYLDYANEKMSGIIDGLFENYGELFGRMIAHQMHANQIRATLPIKMIAGKGDDAKEKAQSYLNKITESFRNNAFAVAPLQDGMDYKEHSGNSKTQSVEEINKATNGFVDKVAMALSIPKSLIYGDMADTKEASKNYMRFCINPLVKQIKDEFNSTFFEKTEILNGDGIDIRPLSIESIFERAEAIDKLISSGAFTPNEVRKEAGKDKVDDPKMDEFYMTKNYQQVNEMTSRGGENE
ncbi:phage portal protein [Salinicoccus sesuvii]|uniref:Phage portal protein n=1 Tax=Salinicoccus sesuvii TaxID=868281 RepID=A0ABV7N6E1_9STAP